MFKIETSRIYSWLFERMDLLCFHTSVHSAGYLISLKDPEIALAIEVCLRGQLQAFTCDNHEDEKVLQGLMAKVFPGGRRPTIITSQFIQHVHDTRRRWDGNIHIIYRKLVSIFALHWLERSLSFKGLLLQRMCVFFILKCTQLPHKTDLWWSFRQSGWMLF